MNEKKARVEDALHATRAAVEEGIVPGGGIAYIRTIPALKEASKNANGDEKIGMDLIAKVLEAPLRQIANNTGADGSVVFEEVKGLSANMAIMPILASMLICSWRVLLILRKYREWHCKIRQVSPVYC